MSAITVNYRGGQDLHLTVYHPSLNRTQIMMVQELEQKSTTVTTNAGLMLLIGVGCLLTGLWGDHGSTTAMMIMSVLTLIGGGVMYALEVLLWYQSRRERVARRFMLEPHELSVSITIPSTSRKLQRRLYDAAVAIRDKKDNKQDIEALYNTVLEYRTSEPSLDTKPIRALMERV